jgi:hypothetical protein
MKIDCVRSIWPPAPPHPSSTAYIFSFDTNKQSATQLSRTAYLYEIPCSVTILATVYMLTIWERKILRRISQNMVAITN